MMCLRNDINTLCIITLYTICKVCTVSSLVINTTTGPIMGKIVKDGTISVTYKAFLGIPYAEPPLRDLRFKPPVPVKPWKGIYNATTAGCACPQINVLDLKEGMSENCLYLNVFAPLKYSNKPLPVLIFIYGGNFRFGSSNPDNIYGPQNILKRNIIVSTMNYRLGPLGFLSLETEDAPGNAGLKDVLVAVEWIYSNIKRFGGDPNQVTIAGESSGAVLAQYLILNKKTNGLFKKAILMSGNVLSSKFMQRYPKENARLLGKKLGLSCTNDDCLIRKLKEVEASAIVAAEEEITREDPRRGIRLYTPFSPCIEKNSPTALITKEPIEYLKTENTRNIPTIIGITNQEGLEIFPVLKLDPNVIDKINENFELCIPPDIEYPTGSEMSQKLANSIRKFYFNNGNISIFNTQNYINLITDTEFTYSTDQLVEILTEQRDSAQLYYYIFEFDGQLNWFKTFENITYPGASHADDLGYIFLPAILKPIYPKMDSRTKEVLSIMQSILANFIKYGDPTPQRGSNGISWPETRKSRRHLVIDDHPRVVWHAPFPIRTEFWRTVYEEYYQYKLSLGI